MKLFVLRHGRAQARASTDAGRELSESGRADLRDILTASRDDLKELSSLWVSPLVRAQQTAQIVAEVLGRPLSMSTTNSLVPEADLSELYDQLQTCDQGTLMLVSHQPLVGDLVNDLVGAEPGQHALGTSALTCIEVETFARGLGDLLWLRQPVG